MSEKKVYILFTDTGTLFTKVIRLYTKEQLNHTSISFSRDLEDVYSFGRKRPHNPFSAGFVKEDLRGVLFEKSYCELYSLSITEHQYNEMTKLINEFEKCKQDYKYNLLGLIAIMFKKEITRKNAFFCSQFVATILSKGDTINMNKPLCFVKPSDIRGLNCLTLEYKGDLKSILSIDELPQVQRRGLLPRFLLSIIQGVF